MQNKQGRGKKETETTVQVRVVNKSSAKKPTSAQPALQQHTAESQQQELICNIHFK